MYETHSRKEKLLLLIKLLFPILITQLAMYSMNFLDTFMSGRAGTNDLAGVAIGSSLWVPVLTGINGILMALTPIISQHLGAKRRDDIPFSLIQTIYLTLGLSVIVIIAGGLALNPILNSMDLDQHVEIIANHYLKALGVGIVPLFMYSVLRGFIDAHGMTRITMVITLLSLPINAIFNYLLIFGKLGFPQMGGVGAGVATTITYWIIMGIAILVIMRSQAFRAYQVFKKRFPVSLSFWKALLKMGIPIGFSIFFETSIFSAVTILMSQFSTVIIAAHQAAMNFASFLYMIPLSISMALTIAVGFEAGAKRYKDAKAYALIGLSVAVSIAVIFAVSLFFLKGTVSGVYSTDHTVRVMIGQFLMFAVFFQLSDAIQAPIQGALRGYKDVNLTLIITLIVYWVIGLPIGFILGKWTTLGPFGYWIGLILGLATGAVSLAIRLHIVQKKHRQTVEER
ncbi:MAG: MATE family efflux transporter [Tuberibacillus sp.]